jgi:hypothetical protein
MKNLVLFILLLFTLQIFSPVLESVRFVKVYTYGNEEKNVSVDFKPVYKKSASISLASTLPAVKDYLEASSVSRFDKPKNMFIFKIKKDFSLEVGQYFEVNVVAG